MIPCPICNQHIKVCLEGKDCTSYICENCKEEFYQRKEDCNILTKKEYNKLYEREIRNSSMYL